MTGLLLRYLGVFAAAGALLWLGTRWDLEWDLSAGGRHTLSPTTLEVLARLEHPLRLTGYVPEKENELRQAVSDFADRYRRHLPTLELEFVDPGEAEDEARELGVPSSGAVHVQYAGGSELLRQLDEIRLTGAIQRLLVRGDLWVVALRGHGERRFDGDANHDFRDFAKALRREGFKPRTLDLNAGPLPDNTGVLVIGDPRAAFLPEEQLVIADWIAGGGNLLWLDDTGNQAATAWLWDQVPVSQLDGVVVDAEGARLGLEDPRLVAVGTYSDHPVTGRLEVLTLLPKPTALAPRAASEEWTTTVLLSSSASSWNETGEVRGEVSRDAESGEYPGPLALAVALERDGQRIVVAGDGDFLSNAYLGNGANLDLGLAMVRWLTHNDALVDIPAPAAPDARIELPRTTVAVVAGVFLFGIPLGMVAAGLLIGLRRKRR